MFNSERFLFAGGSHCEVMKLRGPVSLDYKLQLKLFMECCRLTYARIAAAHWPLAALHYL